MIDMVADRFSEKFGDLEGFRLGGHPPGRPRRRAITSSIMCCRASADHQDAMLMGEDFLYHSLLSPYLNTGLLDPLDLCRRAEEQWRAGKAPPERGGRPSSGRSSAGANMCAASTG